MNPFVDIVIPTYNGALHLPNLLRSIQNQTYSNYICFVIDDASLDTTVSIVQRHFPWVHLIQQHRNRGPSANRNIAWRQGNAPYIVFFDDDIFLSDQDWLQKAISVMESEPQTGQVATMSVSGYDPDILLDCGIYGEPPFSRGIFAKKSVFHVMGKHKISRAVLGACSAATLVRRNIVERIGGFDPIYFYPCEDLDLSIRIHLLGYEVRYVPELVTHHLEGQSMRGQQSRREYLARRNNLLVLLKQYPFYYILTQLRPLLFQIFGSYSKYILKTMLRCSVSRPDYMIQSTLYSLPFLCACLPNIIATRLKVNKYRKKPREYLMTLNNRITREVSLCLPVRNVIFAVTNRCNARCSMCFLHNSINQPSQQLSLSEISRLFFSLHDLQNVVLGGGEPFLRDDLESIASILISQGIKTISIPTNGSMPSRVYDVAKSLLSRGIQHLVVSLSLDGLAPYHDQNRNYPRLFEQVEKCYDQLIKLKAVYNKSMKIQVNTAVSKTNIEELSELADYLGVHMPESTWVIEPIRGNFNPATAMSLSMEQWSQLDQQLEDLHRRAPLDYKMLKPAFQYATTSMHCRAQSVPCCAGLEFIFIDCEGNVAPCELLPAVTNVKELDYDLNRLEGHEQWQHAINDIHDNKCFCTHFCWLTQSMLQQGLYK